MTDHSVTDANNINVNIDVNSNISNASPKIAIIGGGLTGLFTATLLERAFGLQGNQAGSHEHLPQITVFEKSRSVGRLATRYRTDKQTNKNWQWAFGAQFFTAKSDSFSQFIAPWLDSRLLQPWCAQVVELTPANDSEQLSKIKEKEQWGAMHARYISTPKMTSWGRELADNLQHTAVQFKTRVAPLSKQQNDGSQNISSDKKTELFDEDGASLGCFDWVICTAPNGQAVELMADSGFTEQAKISKPQMQACYSLMLGWDSVEQLPEILKDRAEPAWDVAYVNGSIIDRMFIEHHKPAHDPLLPSVTLHARNDWSEEHVDDDIETVKGQLLQAAQQAINWGSDTMGDTMGDTTPRQTDCHRWRYAATVINNNNDKDSKTELSILVDKQHQWIVSGDWCGQGNIESCYQMAEETVKVITAGINK